MTPTWCFEVLDALNKLIFGYNDVTEKTARNVSLPRSTEIQLKVLPFHLVVGNQGEGGDKCQLLVLHKR